MAKRPLTDDELNARSLAAITDVFDDGPDGKPRPTPSDRAAVFTGIVCPSCKEPVAQVEHETPTAMTFVCPGCGNRWSAEQPGAKPH